MKYSRVVESVGLWSLVDPVWEKIAIGMEEPGLPMVPTHELSLKSECLIVNVTSVRRKFL